jgi:hypothetical protein
METLQTIESDATVTGLASITEPTAQLELPPPSWIHHYEIIRELGRGGMGRVFLARDTKLARRVAIKLMNCRNEEFSARFLTEARATAQFQHENIVVIHEVGEQDAQPYMVLEYLEGESLRDLIRRRAHTWQQAIDLILPVTRALACAHALDIVHRDLKPENIFITNSGQVKVLDFGIAKVLRDDDAPGLAPAAPLRDIDETPGGVTRDGAMVGTLQYMSPEQWLGDPIDPRADLWALGLILYELLTGHHPLHPVTRGRLIDHIPELNESMPRVGERATDLPSGVAAVVDRCLAKDRVRRFASAEDVIAALEPYMPGRYGRRLEQGESPYPGLAAFQEDDADRFFGRAADITRISAQVRDKPLVGVVGPSGVGKSSLVRAGVVPALKATGETWQICTLRPGRTPLANLAQAVSRGVTDVDGDRALDPIELASVLWAEPGQLGVLLRSRAVARASRIAVFVDQFEELYTLGASDEERAAFIRCLSGMADDASAPLRVVVAMRSDLLHRAAADVAFMDQLSAGLCFLRPPGREGLRDALTQPLAMVGFGFESLDTVTHMLDEVDGAPGALPLLQFAASRLWHNRDQDRRLITRSQYDRMGGIAGTLATHADEVIGKMTAPSRKLARALFLRLVTPENTRAIVDLDELVQLDSGNTERVVHHLVDARLLVLHSSDESDHSTIEIVHESLVTSWPTLRRWLDEDHEDVAFMAQLRTTARQWNDRGRPVGMLWRGEAMEEARRWSRRHRGTLPVRERAYLDAVLTLANRSVRVRRLAVTSVIIVLVAMVAAASIALLRIRASERRAKEQADIATTEADRARAAEQLNKQQVDELERRETEQLRTNTELRSTQDQRESALERADVARAEAEQRARELRDANNKLRTAVGEADTQRRTAERESLAAQKAAKDLEIAVDEARRAARAEREVTERLEALREAERVETERLRSRITQELQ